MDTSAFDVNNDTARDAELQDLYDRLPKDAKIAIDILLLAACSIAQLGYFAAALLCCAWAFVTLIVWVCLFWLQTRVLLFLASVLRACYDLPSDSNARLGNDGNLAAISADVPLAHLLDENSTSHDVHTVEQLDMFEAYLNSPRESRVCSGLTVTSPPQPKGFGVTVAESDCTSGSCAGGDDASSQRRKVSTPLQSKIDGSADQAHLQAEPSANKRALECANTTKSSFTPEQLQEAASFAAQATRGSSARRPRTDLKKQAPPLRPYLPQKWKQPTHGTTRWTKTLADVSRLVRQQAPKRIHTGPALMHTGDTAVTAKPGETKTSKTGIVPPHLRHRVHNNALTASQDKRSPKAVIAQSHEEGPVPAPTTPLPPSVGGPDFPSEIVEDPNLIAASGGPRVDAGVVMSEPDEAVLMKDESQTAGAVQKTTDVASPSELSTPRISMTIEELKSLNNFVGAKLPKAKMLCFEVLRPSWLLASEFETVAGDVPTKRSSFCQLVHATDTKASHHSIDNVAASAGDTVYCSSQYDDEQSMIKTRNADAPEAVSNKVERTVATLPQQIIAIQRAISSAKKRANEGHNSQCTSDATVLECSEEFDDAEPYSFDRSANDEGADILASGSDTDELSAQAPSSIADKRCSSTLSATAPSFFAPSSRSVSSGLNRHSGHKYAHTTPITTPAESTSASVQSAYTAYPQPITPSVASYIPIVRPHFDCTTTFSWQNPLFQDVTHGARRFTASILPANYVNDSRNDPVFTSPPSFFETASTDGGPRLASRSALNRSASDAILDTSRFSACTSPTNVLSQLPSLDSRFTVRDSPFKLGKENERSSWEWGSQEPVVEEAIVNPRIRAPTANETPRIESAGDDPADLANKSSCKKQRRQARADLTDAWHDREGIRKRLAATWTLDGARALEGATAVYNATRTLLAQSMSKHELSEEDSKMFPQLGKADLSVPKIRPNGRPGESIDASTFANTSASCKQRRDRNKKKHNILTDIIRSNGTSEMKSAVNTMLASGSKEDLTSVAIEAREKYLAAHNYFERPPPQGRANLRDLRAQGEKRIELAAKRYRDKIRAVEDAYGGKVPERLRDEFWWLDDQHEKKLRDMWNL